MKVKGTNIIAAGEERDLDLQATANGKKADLTGLMVFHLDPEEEHERARIGLVIKFKNAAGRRYITMIETGLGGLTVKSVKKLNTIVAIQLSLRKLKENLWIYWSRFFWLFSEPHIEDKKK